MEYTVDLEPDSFALLKGAPDQSVDVMITDPPYSAHVHENLCSGSLVGTKSVPKYELGFAPLTGYEWIRDAVRVTKRWVVVFCDLEAFGLMKQVVPESYVRGCVWYKSNAMGQLTGDRPATAYEGVALFHGSKEGGHPKKRWNGKGSYGIWRCNGTRGKEERHPNEKPMDLALKLVSLFSERGETVFDPFCGSGAIGEACSRLGRGYVGLDQDSNWVGRTRARLCMPKSFEAMSDQAALGLCSMKGEDPLIK